MQCPECQDLLQRRLDGEALASSGAWEEHLAGCASCRALHAAGDMLLKGLRRLPAPMLPLDFSQRLTGLVLEERRARRRRVRWRLAVTAALAACVLIMAIAGNFLPIQNDSAATKPVAKDNKKETPAKTSDLTENGHLAKSVAGARQAFASLSERWADRAKEQAKAFLSANPIDLPEFKNLPDLAKPLAPAAQSLKQAGQGVAGAFEPVATSARRALTYLVHELPVLDAKN